MVSQIVQMLCRLIVNHYLSVHFFHLNGFLLVFIILAFHRHNWGRRRKVHSSLCTTDFEACLNPITKNCDLSDKGDKEESWITSMLVLGLKDLFSKEMLMVRERSLEKTL